MSTHNSPREDPDEEQDIREVILSQPYQQQGIMRPIMRPSAPRHNSSAGALQPHVHFADEDASFQEQLNAAKIQSLITFRKEKPNATEEPEQIKQTEQKTDVSSTVEPVPPVIPEIEEQPPMTQYFFKGNQIPEQEKESTEEKPSLYVQYLEGELDRSRDMMRKICLATDQFAKDHPDLYAKYFSPFTENSWESINSMSTGPEPEFGYHDYTYPADPYE
jgi:hypothetical protein